MAGHGWPGGGKHPNASLTDAEAEELREMRAEGTSFRDLALLFRVSRTAATDIVRGSSYKSAGGPVEPAGTWRRSFGMCPRGKLREGVRHYAAEAVHPGGDHRVAGQ